MTSRCHSSASASEQGFPSVVVIDVENVELGARMEEGKQADWQRQAGRQAGGARIGRRAKTGVRIADGGMGKRLFLGGSFVF